METTAAVVIGTGDIVPVPEPQPPLATGTFVNFESPQVKPLTLSSDGTILLATNTPNNTLLVLDTGIGTATPMQRINEIAVGLDPVSVAIQPGTGDNLAWVANFISDNVSVVDLSLGTVVSVIDVGDEPVNILFDATGAFAFVVIQGSPADVGGGPIVQEGQLIAIDTATRLVVDHVFLDCNTPRAAVYNPATGQVTVAALHSGNDTTVVGDIVQFFSADPNAVGCQDRDGDGNTDNPITCGFPVQSCTGLLPLLCAVQNFSATAGIFSAACELGPNYPDKSQNIAVVGQGPLVHRIVFDAGNNNPKVPMNCPTTNGWNQIVNTLSIDDGTGNLIPDPAMVALMNQEFNIINADDIIDPNNGNLLAAGIIPAIINDAKDTLDHDLITVDVSDPAGAGLSIVNKLGGVGTTLTGMAINANGEIFVSNLEPLNTVRTEPSLNGHFIDHQIVIVINPQSPGALIVPTDLHDGIPGFNDGTNIAEAQNKSLANPVDIVFDDNTDPGLVTAYVASLGADRVGSLHGTTASVLGRVDIGRGPRGLALDSTANLLYAINRTDMTINKLDVTDRTNMQVLETVAVFNPEPKVIKNGRDFLYSTRRSDNFASSCGMCHIDGTDDHLSWDLGDPVGGFQPPPPNLSGLNNHPMKGPMFTLSLQGLDRHEPLHWRSDHPIFQDFNSAFASLLGGSQIPSEDMDAFAAFVKTINYGPNPFRNRDDSFKDPVAQVGLDQWLGPNGVPQGSANCQICHQVEHGGALAGPIGDGDDQGILLIGSVFFMQLEEITQLRGIHKKLNSDLYNGFGTIHDGREEREPNNPFGCVDNPLCTFIAEFFPSFFTTPAPPPAPAGTTIADGIIAFTEAFPTNAKPVVGWQVKPSMPVSSQEQIDINTMITQHDKVPSRNDVIATGLVGGQPRGFVLIATDPGIIFESDLGGAVTLNDLFNRINSGAAELVFTATPPGSGFRIGVDQDSDGILNGLDAMPQVNNDADVNLNGVADGDDVQSFLSVLFDPGSATIQAFNAADANNDTFVDIADVDAVVAILLHGCQ